jgi:hypothetical protein
LTASIAGSKPRPNSEVLIRVHAEKIRVKKRKKENFLRV